jgi:exopolyphosphatase/guanosine-5'-triphosphate,3'-diphosphate pyrophosphatase
LNLQISVLPVTLKLAAIDIGSNSIKLVVVDAAASDSFAVLARDKEVVRLGHETLTKGRLSPEAIERAITCIQRFRTAAEVRQAEVIVAVATASVREASNASQFIKQVEKATGIRVEVLSGVEEARLIGLAASRGCANRGAINLNIDIGGGSTEISLFRDGTPLSLFSVRVGAVRLTDRYLKSDPPKPKQIAGLQAEVFAAFQRPARELRNAKWQQASGTSGTILAIGATLRANDNGDADSKDLPAQPTEAEVPLSRLSELNKILSSKSQSERRALEGISSQRAEIIVAGGCILEAGMRALGINSLRTCDWALREGVIIDYLQEQEDEAQPSIPDFADQKLRAVHAVGRRFGYEETHARQVAKLAEQLFECLADAEGLSRHQRTLMLAGALLHDIGYHIAHESHQRHALYLIVNSELTGFSEVERSVIANIARYHRGSLPKERHREYAVLNAADRDSVCKLGGIVRLADALDRSHDSRVTDLHCRAGSSSVHIELESALDCHNEIVEAERKKELLEQAFSRRLILTTPKKKAKGA